MLVQLVKNPAVAIEDRRILRIGCIGALIQRPGSLQLSSADRHLCGQQRHLRVLWKERDGRLELALCLAAHFPADERANQRDVRLRVARRALDRVAQRRGGLYELLFEFIVGFDMHRVGRPELPRSLEQIGLHRF